MGCCAGMPEEGVGSRVRRAVLGGPWSEDEAVETSTAEDVSKNEAVAAELGMRPTLSTTVLCETANSFWQRAPRIAVRSGILLEAIDGLVVGTEMQLEGKHFALGRRAVLRVGGTEVAFSREPVALRHASSPVHVKEQDDFASNSHECNGSRRRHRRCPHVVCRCQ